jgi:hypothetical protein
MARKMTSFDKTVETLTLYSELLRLRRLPLFEDAVFIGSGRSLAYYYEKNDRNVFMHYTDLLLFHNVGRHRPSPVGVLLLPEERGALFIWRVEEGRISWYLDVREKLDAAPSMPLLGLDSERLLAQLVVPICQRAVREEGMNLHPTSARASKSEWSRLIESTKSSPRSSQSIFLDVVQRSADTPARSSAQGLRIHAVLATLRLVLTYHEHVRTMAEPVSMPEEDLETAELLGEIACDILDEFRATGRVAGCIVQPNACDMGTPQLQAIAHGVLNARIPLVFVVLQSTYHWSLLVLETDGLVAHHYDSLVTQPHWPVAQRWTRDFANLIRREIRLRSARLGAPQAQIGRTCGFYALTFAGDWIRTGDDPDIAGIRDRVTARQRRMRDRWHEFRTQPSPATDARLAEPIERLLTLENT